MERDLFALIEPAIADNPERTALVTPDGQEVTYRSLASTVYAFTAAASVAGLRRGDRVTVEIDNYAVKLCLILALSRLGAVTVIGGTTRAIVSEGISIDAVISVDRPRQASPRLIPFSQDWFNKGSESDRRDPANGYLNRGDPTIVAASSGTTGTKKFMAFSVETFAERMAVYDQMTGVDRNRLTTVGADTVWGMLLILRTLQMGGTVVTPADSPRATLDRINDRRIEALFTIPNVVVDLVEAQKTAFLELPTLKTILIGGGNLSPHSMREAAELLCPRVRTAYGASETGPVAMADLEQLGAAPGSVGFLASWADVEAIDDDGRELPRGETGRLRVRIPETFRPRGYLNAGAGEAFQDGWFYPGDLGYVTDEGLLVVTGRVTDVINTGGNKLSPVPIEALIAAEPGVVQVGVVGVKNSNGFDDVGIAVVAEPTLDTEQLRRSLVKKLGSNTPLRLELVGELPFNAGGKLDRGELRALFIARGK